MSRASSSVHVADPDPLGSATLSLDFEGLLITVSGPSERALTFVRRLSEERGDPSWTVQNVAAPAPGSTSVIASSVPFVPRAPPRNILELATELRSKKVPPRERIERAWTAGEYARARFFGYLNEYKAVTPLEISSKYHVVVRSYRHQRTKIFYNTDSFREAIGTAEDNGEVDPIFFSFPTRVEARVYCTALGTGVPEELL